MEMEIESVMRVIGSGVVAFMLMAPIFLFATSIFCKWDWRIIILLATITFFEWLVCLITIYNESE